jgi:cell division protease FtsH
VSAETKTLIEAEVKALIDEGYETARRILIEKSDEFERLAKGLLEYETLTGDEIKKVIRGEALGGDDVTPPPSSGGTESIAALPKTRKPRAPKGGDPEPTPVV